MGMVGILFDGGRDATLGLTPHGVIADPMRMW
jgi:hypothetical protein